MPIHKEGYPFIALFVAVNLLAFLLAAWLGWLLLPVHHLVRRLLPRS